MESKFNMLKSNVQTKSLKDGIYPLTLIRCTALRYNSNDGLYDSNQVHEELTFIFKELTTGFLITKDVETYPSSKSELILILLGDYDVLRFGMTIKELGKFIFSMSKGRVFEGRLKKNNYGVFKLIEMWEVKK